MLLYDSFVIQLDSVPVCILSFRPFWLTVKTFYIQQNSVFVVCNSVSFDKYAISYTQHHSSVQKSSVTSAEPPLCRFIISPSSCSPDPGRLWFVFPFYSFAFFRLGQVFFKTLFFRHGEAESEGFILSEPNVDWSRYWFFFKKAFVS